MALDTLKNIDLTPAEDVLKDIQLYGSNSLSYSAMQDGIKRFRHPAFKGFIAYKKVWGVAYVLADPITPVEDYVEATQLFIKSQKLVVFCQASYLYASVLNYLGYTVNALGIETLLDCQNFKFGWRDKKCLKSYYSKLTKEAYHVFECFPEPTRVYQISRQWLNDKLDGRELQFMARPFNGIAEKDVRYFYLIKGKAVIGFCSFDPVYSGNGDGLIVSYVLQHARFNEEAPLGSQDYIILNALQQFKAEGLKYISLGLSPLYKRENRTFRYSKNTERVFAALYKHHLFYNYSTMGSYKDHYKGKNIQTFVATSGRFTVRSLGGLLKVNNMLSIKALIRK